jgi:hypothetical protein
MDDEYCPGHYIDFLFLRQCINMSDKFVWIKDFGKFLANLGNQPQNLKTQSNNQKRKICSEA